MLQQIENLKQERLMSIKSTAKYTVATKCVNAAKLGAIALMIAMSSTAHADDFLAAKKIEVKVKVAELTSPTGIKKVYADLSAEAMSACTPNRMVMSKRTIERCAADLLDQFVEDLDVEALTKLHTVREA